MSAPPLARRPGWQDALAAAMCNAAMAPFEWGVNDCCLFTADCVAAMTGHDPAARYRGAYRTYTGAARLIARAGGTAALVRKCLAATEIPAAQAGLGDVALVVQPNGEEVVAVHGGAGWHAPGIDGLLWMPAHWARTAWRVG